MRVFITILGTILVVAMPLACSQSATAPPAEEETEEVSAQSSAAITMPEKPPRPVASPGKKTAKMAVDPPPATSSLPIPPAATSSSTDSQVAMTVQKPIIPLSTAVPGAVASSGAIVLPNCLISLIEEAQVPAQVPSIEGGVLLQLHFKEGQLVKQNELLAEVDDVRARLQQDAAVAKLKVAEEKATSDIGVRYAKAAAELAKAMWEVAVETNRRVENTIPQVEVRKLLLDAKRAFLEIEQADLQERIDELEVAVSQAELKAAVENIKRYKILSPMDAVVRKVYRHRGEWVKPGEPVMHVVRVDQLRVEGVLNIRKYLPSDVVGKPVTVAVTFPHGEELFKAQVTFVDPDIQSGGDYWVWAEVQNRQRNGQFVLLPGMNATMTIHNVK